MNIRLILALIVGKTLARIIRILKTGGGSAAPGYYALKLDPNLVRHLAPQIGKSVVITGTNGKTTTAKMLDLFAKTNELKVIRNGTGSNLERGVASSLIKQAYFWGQMKHFDLAIWEVDEAAFNKLVPILKPEIIVFLNAFRDQLDRYGEVDHVVAQWQDTLDKIKWLPTLVINASDFNTRKLLDTKNCPIKTFSVDGYQIKGEATLNTPKDTKSDYSAKISTTNLNGSNFEYQHGQVKTYIILPIPGAYHVYDFLAATATADLLDIPLPKVIDSIQAYKPAFGRVEKVKIGATDSVIFLIKNPVGASLVIETITNNIDQTDLLLLCLNDNFADGTDISWIWDAEFEKLVTKQKYPIICSGTRAADLAVRLKYAGIKTDRITVIEDLNLALRQALVKKPDQLFILPTYTALLQIQKTLAKQKHKTAYWQE